MIEVQWFYKKTDLDTNIPGLDKRLLDSLADNEVFETTHKDVIYIETINEECQVFKLDDYENLPQIE